MKQTRGRVLVTGGTGYIGSHTVVELIAGGYEVVIIDNYSNSKPSVAAAIGDITGITPQVAEIDLCDESALDNFFAGNRDIDSVIHFAALKAVGESVRDPLAYYRNNLVSLINLLRTMKRYSVGRLVFSSSCTVYGEPATLPVTEEHPVQLAESPYGNTKRISEEIIRDLVMAGDEDSLTAISLRYFNPIGAHPSALIGEDPSGDPENLVPYITRTAAGLYKELKVFGNDYNTPDGTAIRDYLYVGDLAAAHVAALKRIAGGKSRRLFEVFNLGTGKGVSVLEAVGAFERATGVKVPLKIAPRRSGDIEKIWADVQLANRELKWKTVTSLEEAMGTAWRWEMRTAELRKEAEESRQQGEVRSH